MTALVSVRLKYVATLNDELLSETVDPGLEISYIDIGSVGTGRLVEPPEVLAFGDAPSRARRKVRTDDTIVSTVRTYLRGILPIGPDIDGAIVSTGFAVVRPRPNVSGRFLSWALQGDQFVGEVVARSSGVSYPAIAPSELADIALRIPCDSDQQRNIAAYIDNESQRLDALSRFKERLIAAVDVKRRALTYFAVTGGFNPARTLLKSDVSWAPLVPDGWRTPLLNKVARMGSGHTPSRSSTGWWVNTTIPWITTGEVHQIRDDRVEYVTETRESISYTGLANSAAELHPAGTVFLSRTASAGFSGIMGTDMATSQDFVTWTCGPHLDPRYLLLCLRTMRRDLLERLAQGSTHKTIYMPDLASIKVPLPPLQEQRAIVEKFWSIASKIDSAVDKLTSQLSLLAERRQSLITHAVTGQLDESTLRGHKPMDETIGEVPA